MEFNEMLRQIKDADSRPGAGNKQRRCESRIQRTNEGSDRLVQWDEKPLRIGVSDCERSALSNLLKKQRKDTALRSEHIAQAHNLHAGRRPETEKQEFGDALGGSHDAARLDCLVRGHQDKLVHMARDGGMRQSAGTEHIVFDGREGILFHQRNMLQSCGMEDNLGLIPGHCMIEDLRIADAAQKGNMFSATGLP